MSDKIVRAIALVGEDILRALGEMREAQALAEHREADRGTVCMCGRHREPVSYTVNGGRLQRLYGVEGGVRYLCKFCTTNRALDAAAAAGLVCKPAEGGAQRKEAP